MSAGPPASPPRARSVCPPITRAANIVIQVADDGRGLNRDAILRKARAQGLVKESDVLSDAEVNGLIFEPGFSTAKVVTEISGRGVGMDVVKRNIDALRGARG